MARVTTSPCEVCGVLSASTRRYEVRGDGARARVMLCEVHGFPLAELLRVHGKATRAGVPDGRKATIEEIEAMKRAEKV